MLQRTQSGRPSGRLRWSTVGVLGAVALVWAGQAGGIHHGTRTICRRQGFLAWVPNSIVQAGLFTPPPDIPEQDAPAYRPSCWAGQLPPKSSIAVADWSFRATIIGVGGLYGP